MIFNFLPPELKAEFDLLADYPGYINRKQIAKACGVEESTATNWRKKLPSPDKEISGKYYWLPATIAKFISEYREKNNPT